VYAAYAEEDADFDKLAEEQARLEAILAASGADTEHQLDLAAEPCACRRGREHQDPLGGEKRRVALCKLLLSRPDMLLLDEPTNHLDAESVEWLEQFLTRFPAPWSPSPMTATSRQCAEWILELDRGHAFRGRAIIPTGWNRRKRGWRRSQAGRRT